MNEPLVLGGPLSPLGWSVGFVEAPLGAAVTALTDWWKRIGFRLKSGATTGPLLDQLRALDPLESGYTRHLLVETRGDWTACFDNSIDGGDQASWCTQLALELDVSCVLASHVPAEHYPYPSTQLELLGPEGEPPLMYIRSLSAGIYDSGGWEWYALGPPQPWEEPDRYLARRVRDRLDRPLLVEYLRRLGIFADDPGFYGDGFCVRKKVSWRVATTGRKRSLASLQSEYGIS